MTCNRDEDVWLSILCELEHISWSAILSLFDHEMITHKHMGYLDCKLSEILEAIQIDRNPTNVDQWL